MICNVCKRKNLVENDIPIFSDDKYWGKVSENELKDIISIIDKEGFRAFDVSLQKKFDFTYNEDRADWRVYVPLAKDSVILDIGAGLGRITIPLARIAGKVIACDQSFSRMRFLKRRADSENLGNIDVVVADVFDLPFKEESFDLIVLNGVLEWVGCTNLFKDPKEAQIKCLEICRRLLKKGGRLYIGIENRFALAYLRASDHGGLRYTSFMPRFVANLYSKIRGKGPYRTYTYSARGYKRLLFVAGFDNPPDFYLLYPGYNLPRAIAPYDNINAFKYLIRAFKRPRNFIKRLIYNVVSMSLIIRLYRLFFFSFGIISKK
jgi:ubiquinone/menaquinone biosynthesis C-methylase UbiE